MIRKALIAIAGLSVLAVAALAANWHLQAPRHDRDWQPLYDRLPHVEAADGAYRVSNIRNWSYGPGGETEPEWITAELDPDDIVAAWFIVEPFGDMRAVAHTMLGFEFADGAVYVASVEARREAGETYGGLKAGLLPMHEYMFVWTTERDMFGNSTFHTGDALHLYRLTLSPEAAGAVPEAMLAETVALEEEPRWYNTFFSNCTNVLARAVNRQSPQAVPWDISWYLPGYAAGFLHEAGFIAGEGDFAALEARAHVTGHVEALYGIEDPAAFSAAIRRALYP